MTHTTPAATSDAPDAPGAPGASAQRRILTVLVVSQILSGAGLAAGITVGALLAQDMLGSTGLSGLPSALFTAGSALTAVIVGRISQARGRRPGLAAGYATGALGSVGVIAAAAVDSAPLLFAALFVYGAGTATNLQARYAGADLAAPRHRGRALSTVLVATTLGGVVGPNLASATGNLAATLGIPRLAGPFLLAGVAYGAAAAILALWLRPDPLLLARALADRPPPADATAAAATAVAPPGKADQRPADRPLPCPVSADPAAPTDHPTERPTELAGEPATAAGGILLGGGLMVVSQLVMVAIMTMTPVHMHAHGHGTAASGLVIGIHVGAMYLPSPLTGILVDRLGRLPVAAASGLTLLASGVLAAIAPPDSIALLALALALLGLGWNFGLLSGTAIITDTIPLAIRARTQGLVDVSIALAGATGGMASGIVVAAAGFPALALTGGIISLAMLPALAATARRAR